MQLKARIKRMVPPAVLNNIMLTFPQLYKTKLVCFESNLEAGGGLEDLQQQLESVLSLDGDIAECGSSRCGTSIFMANYLRRENVKKTIYAFDSFEGFEPEEIKKEKALGWNTSLDGVFTSTSYEYVKKKIAALGVDDTITPIKGYFQQTLRTVDASYCLALIDCDLHDSLIYCAEKLWPKLASGGCLVFDDYTADQHHGARLGVDLFINKYSEEISGHGLMQRLYYARKA